MVAHAFNSSTEQGGGSRTNQKEGRERAAPVALVQEGHSSHLRGKPSSKSRAISVFLVRPAKLYYLFAFTFQWCLTHGLRGRH